MKTASTDLFGIAHPVIQGGMHYVGFAELAAAVSNAGGQGVITALTRKSAKDLANEIAHCQDMTDKPYAVNITFLPTLNPPDYPAYVETIIEGGVRGVETAGRTLLQVVSYLKDAGIKIIHTCTSVRHALKVQEIGCDAVWVDGFECGGHPGEDDILEEVVGVYPKIMIGGTMDAGAWSCGMVAGLIKDIPTCKELVNRTMAEAREIIKGRLAGVQNSSMASSSAA